MSDDPPDVDRYLELFAAHRSGSVKNLRPWQRETLEQYAALEAADAAIEAPTGSGKTLPALLIAEEFRQRTKQPVAYLAGNKQLARQVERQARDLSIPVVRFQGSKYDWDSDRVTDYAWGEAIAVANYWNYFNENPGLGPAGLLILDDVHLLESPLRGFFTTEIKPPSPLYRELLAHIVTRFPYYGLAADLLAGTTPPGPPEMLAFVDSAEIAPELRAMIDARLEDGGEPWWAWQRIRSRAEVCCWLVSARAVTVTPFVPPTQEIPHFANPQRRLYLSATVGSVDDVQRRLGCRPFEKLSATVPARQGERFIVLSDAGEAPTPTEHVALLRPFLERHRKALWLCARSETASAYEAALVLSALPGNVRRLYEDNGADEQFANASEGHLVAAGRFDGMDFPDDACRLEILPETPIAVSDLEEFVMSFLRDATFGEARFAQRVAQALGRCNRSEDDRAVYLLTDPGFLGQLREPRLLAALPAELRDDIASAVRRQPKGFASNLAIANHFLRGKEVPKAQAPALLPSAEEATTGKGEVDAMLALWREDYARAAEILERRVINRLPAASREYKAFWISMRALALTLQERKYEDGAAGIQAREALRAAASVGATTVFFARLGAALARAEGRPRKAAPRGHNALFAAWDKLIQTYGTNGRPFEDWADKVITSLESGDHDTVARAIATVGSQLLGLATAAPQATDGEEDALWWLPGAARAVAFEVKLAPKAREITNHDVQQAEGALRALAKEHPETDFRGLIMTPHDAAERSAVKRLDRVRLIETAVFIDEVRELIRLLRVYRTGWSANADDRAARRGAVESDLPSTTWLWRAAGGEEAWVDSNALTQSKRSSATRA